MKFSRALKEIVWRLVTEERVSYHSIRRDYGLDDNQLEDLRCFLVQTKALATDEEGKFLVWTNAVGHGFAPRPITDASPIDATQVVAKYVEAVAPAPQPKITPTTDIVQRIGAERRQLTVMFCDLVGSTDLSSRLDPEDMADIIRAYQAAATAIIQRFDGYIAKFMGDGILVYFGYPYAHEKEAGRAVRTGLAILDAMPSLNAEINATKKTNLAVRIGIATGVVMVGESIDTSGIAEKTVVGETPNLASRLQGLAAPNSIVISSVTKDLAGGEFVYSKLGTHELKGITEPMEAWAVTGLVEAAAETASEIIANAPFLVGRDEEIGLLRRAWQQCHDEKRGQVVLVSGEAGIGKSSLIRSLRAEVQKQQLPRLTFRCSPYHTNSALYPVIEHIKRTAGWQPQDTNATKLGKLERLLSSYKLPKEETVPLLSGLLSLPVPEERYAALRLTPQQLKQQTEDVLLALMFEEAERQPTLEIWEDLHWADPSTLQLLGILIEQAPTASLLLVLTFRPEFSPPWTNRSHMTPITLGRLERPQIEVLTRVLAKDKEVPREVLDYVVRKTDGVPLYVEELTKTVLASGILDEEKTRYVLNGPLSGLSIPASLQDVLMARLDRLPTVRDVAQLGAVFGREFAYDMLLAIAVFEEPKLKDGLSQLVDAELLYQRGRPPRSTYTFKHALIQDAAYQSLLKRTRQQYHRLAGLLLEGSFPEIVDAQPELIAHHYAESGRTKQAIDYFHRAAKQAARRSANHEVIAHARRALDLLKTGVAKPGPTASEELELELLLGTALMATQGYASPETGASYSRARELCRMVGSGADICPVLSGVWLFELTRANHVVGREVAEEILSSAASGNDVEARVVGHVAAALSELHIGAPLLAKPHFKQALDLYQAHPVGVGYRYGVEFGLVGYSYAAWCDWLLGYPDQAITLGTLALAALKQEQHAYTSSRGFYWNAVLYQFLGKWPLVEELAERAINSAREHGFALVVAAAQIMRGAARAALDDHEAGIQLLREGLEAYRATGARFQRPYHMALLADALRNAGHLKEASAVIEEAGTLVKETGERYYEAEIYRLRGGLLLASTRRGEREKAMRLLRSGFEIASNQQAKSLQLFAARDIAAVWAEDGKHREAHELLKSVYETFSEGLDMPALASSRQLLDELQ